jgi:hypothetical protein
MIVHGRVHDLASTGRKRDAKAATIVRVEGFGRRASPAASS